MKKVIVGIALIMLATALVWDAKSDESAGQVSHRRDAQVSRLITMYRSDPLTHGISLRTGEPGLVLTEDGMANHQSDLDFGHYAEDGLSVGIEGGKKGVIVDLGAQDELAKRYGYEETVGKGQGFAGIRLVDGKIIGRHGGELGESADLFASSRRGALGSTPAHLDHIYLVRLTDRHDDGFERIAKLIVVGHRSNESVTIRWVVLKDEGGR